jgi:Tfp pilus assembly protein PilO
VAARLEAKRSLAGLAQTLTAGRLHPSRLLLIVAALILVAYVTLAVSYIRHRDQRDSYAAAVVDSEAALAAAQSGESIEDLEMQVAELTRFQEELATAFPSELKTPDVIETLMRNAQEHRVSLLHIEIGPPELIEYTGQQAEAGAPATPDPGQVDRHTATQQFSRAIVNAQLRGDLHDLASFMGALEAAVSGASRLEQVSLKSTPEGFVLDIQVHTYARVPGATPAAATPESGS